MDRSHWWITISNVGNMMKLDRGIVPNGVSITLLMSPVFSNSKTLAVPAGFGLVEP